MESVVTASLAEFLSQPNIEASPAWELVNGYAVEKPMPTLFHSRLQRNLVNYINQHLAGYEAVQELRCVVSPYSPVPDISVVACHRLPEEDGPLPHHLRLNLFPALILQITPKLRQLACQLNPFLING